MPTLSVGTTFAGCRLEAVAGRGGMGVVYRATQLALDRPVALKAVVPHFAEDSDYRGRFQRESHLTASIDHPNVIPVYEAGELEGTLYLIMRWVDGIDLRGLLRSEGRLPPARAVRLLRPVASALAVAHRRGLVHRDIKPANVLIARGDGESDEHVYLTDFGIARQADGESGVTKTGTFVGTLEYTAPERISDGKGGPASDIYSFGCMLFEALTGHVPFERPTDVAMMFAHVNDPVPAAREEVPGVPEALDAIVARAMAKRPEDRFRSAGELVAELDRALAEVQTEERRVAASAARSERRSDETRIRAVRPPEPGARPLTDPVAPEAAGTPAAHPGLDGSPPAPVTRQPPARRRAVLATSLAALVVAGVILVAVSSSGGSGHKASTTASTPQASTTASTPQASSTASTTQASEVKSVTGSGLIPRQAIALGGTPSSISASPLGSVWVSLQRTGTIASVNVATGATTKFHVGGSPTAIAAGNQGVWVSGSAHGPLALFNLQSGAQRAQAPLSAAPSAIAVDPNDGSAWAAEPGGNVTHVAISGQVFTPAAQVHPAPIAIGWGENAVWAVNGSAQGLVRVNPGGGQATTFNTSAAPVSVTFDGGVWTAHADGHITRFDPRAGHLDVNADVAVAPELDGIGAVEMDPSVLAISKQTKELYRISNTSRPAVTGTVVFASAPVGIALDGQSAWVATQDGKLVPVGY